MGATIGSCVLADVFTPALSNFAGDEYCGRGACEALRRRKILRHRFPTLTVIVMTFFPSLCGLSFCVLGIEDIVVDGKAQQLGEATDMDDRKGQWITTRSLKFKRTGCEMTKRYIVGGKHQNSR
jgi:hypothetical protein